jgi:hypothetical protein
VGCWCEAWAEDPSSEVGGATSLYVVRSEGARPFFEVQRTFKMRCGERALPCTLVLSPSRPPKWAGCSHYKAALVTVRRDRHGAPSMHALPPSPPRVRKPPGRLGRSVNMDVFPEGRGPLGVRGSCLPCHHRHPDFPSPPASPPHHCWNLFTSCCPPFHILTEGRLVRSGGLAHRHHSHAVAG